MLVVVYVSLSFAGNALNAASEVAESSIDANAVSAQSNNKSGQSGTPLLTNAAQKIQQFSGNDPSAAQAPVTDAQTRVAADNAARNVARATWWGVALLVLGAIISAAAGNLGYRHQLLEEVLSGADASPAARVVPTRPIREEVDPIMR